MALLNANLNCLQMPIIVGFSWGSDHMQPNHGHADLVGKPPISWSDDPQVSKQKVKSPVSEFGMSRDELYYQATGDVSVLVDAWRKLDISAHPHMKGARDFILTEWERRPELHGQHDDAEVYLRHGDFFEVLVSIKYSLDAISNPHGMLSLLIPGTMEPAWCSPARG